VARAIPSAATLKPVTANDFAIAQMQASLFTPDEEVSSAKLLKELTPRWQSRFDGDPFVLPVSTGVPREVPRLVLHQKNGEWRCEISSERINVFWLKARADLTFPESFAREAVPLLTEYVEFQRARVGRMAAVVTRYTPYPQPGLFLARHFCQERWADAPLNRPENFELHAHKTFVLGNKFRVNSWVRNKTGMSGSPSGQSPVIVVEQDLNTLLEELATNSFSATDVARFFAAAQSEFEVILNLYYPREDAL
jgi:hypothetical protein